MKGNDSLIDFFLFYIDKYIYVYVFKNNFIFCNINVIFVCVENFVW